MGLILNSAPYWMEDPLVGGAMGLILKSAPYWMEDPLVGGHGPHFEQRPLLDGGPNSGGVGGGMGFILNSAPY